MYDKVLTNATKLAGKAQDGIFRHAGKTYTLTFNRKEWVYVVNDGVDDFLRINDKSLSSAKRFLKFYLEN